MRAKLTSLLMVLCLLMVFAAVVQAAPAGKVTNLEGRADLTAPGQPAKVLFIGDAVNVGDILRTKSASKLEVTWIDGSIARLSENSRLKVTEFSMGAQKRSTILSLFRGKVQSIVTGTTKLFGAKGGSKYEVHTPTSVCGVRGTIFFTYHENGISGALFTKGQGFMYSKGQPENVKPVAPGILMIVTSANKPPEAKPAKPGDATKLFNATNPSEKKKDDKKDEGKKEGGTTASGSGTTAASGKDESTGGTKTEDTGSTTTTTTTTSTTETTGTTDTTMLGGDPTATLGTAPPGTLASQIESGTTADTPGTSSPLTNPTTPVAPVVVPVIEPEPTTTPTETTFTQQVTLGDITGTLTGKISNAGDTINTGTLALSGNGQTTTAISTINAGSISDSSTYTYDGYLAGMPGSWSGLFTGLTNKGGSSSLLKGSLSDANYSGSSLSATGSITRGAAFTISGSLFDIYNGTIPVPSYFSYPYSTTYYGQGYNTSLNGLIAVWSLARTGGVSPFPGIAETLPFHYYEYCSSTPFAYLYKDNLVRADDGNGHFEVSGDISFMNDRYYGLMSMNTKAVKTDYAGDGLYYYDEIGVGSYVLDPLKYYGSWGTGGQNPSSLYYNNSGFMTLAGHEEALIGGLTKAPWESSTDFKAIGQYGFTPGLGGYTYYLWNSSDLVGYAPSYTGKSYGGYFEGLTAGIWGSSKKGAIRAIYVTPVSGGSSTAGILVSDDIATTLYSDVGMWTAAGNLAPYSGPTYTGDPVYWSINAAYLSETTELSGSFTNAVGSSITGRGSEFYTYFLFDTQNDSTPPWGIYNLKFTGTNTFSGKPSGEPAWSGQLGGKGQFGYGYSSTGYWMASLASGVWTDDGQITGSMSGSYLTPTYEGNIAPSPLYGVNISSGGTWIGESIGIYEGMPLSFSGNVNPSIRYYYGTFSDDGSLSGLVGSVDPLWETTSAESAAITLMGKYSSGYASPYYIFNDETYSNNALKSQKTTYDSPPGSFFAVYGGIIRNSSVESLMAGLYIDPSGNAGFLKGDLSGVTYTGINMWEATGSLYQTDQMQASIGIAPENLYDQLRQSTDFGGKIAITNTLQGSLGYNANYYNTVHSIYKGTTSYPWGIWQASAAGDYETVSAPWTAKAGGSGSFGAYNSGGSLSDDSGYWIADINGSQWSDNKLAGTVSGKFLTKNKMGNAGLVSETGINGDMLGTYSAGMWQAVAMGTWRGTPLAFSGSVDWGSCGYFDLDPRSATYNKFVPGDPSGLLLKGIFGSNDPFIDDTATLSGIGTYYAASVYPLYEINISKNLNAAFKADSLNLWFGGTKNSTQFAGKMMGLYANWNSVNEKYDVGYLTSGSALDEPEKRYQPVTANLYSSIGMWELTSGALTSSSKGTLDTGDDVTPQITETDTPRIGSIAGTKGITGTSNSYDMYFTDADGTWGVWRSETGGTYTSDPTSGWTGVDGTVEMVNNPIQSYSISHLTGTAWADGQLAATSSGRFLSLEGTGTSSGDILGVYDSAAKTWQALGIGQTEQTETLAFSSLLTGNLYQVVPGTLYNKEYQRPYGETSPYNSYFDPLRYETVYFKYGDPETYNPTTTIGFEWAEREGAGDTYKDEYHYYPSGKWVKITKGQGITHTAGSGDTSSDLVFDPPNQYTNFNATIVSGTTPFVSYNNYVSSFSTTWNTNALIQNGAFTGILGGLNNYPLWSSDTDHKTNLILMGSHDAYNGSQIFGTSMSYDGSGTNNGAFYGALAGIIQDTDPAAAYRENPLEGLIVGLYIDPDGKAGALKGNFTGKSYTGVNMWESTDTADTAGAATVYRYSADMASRLDPTTLADNIFTGDIGPGINSAVYGTFGGSVSIRSPFGLMGRTYSIASQPDWGVFTMQVGLANTYEKSSAATGWTSTLFGSGIFGKKGIYEDLGYWYTDLTAGTWTGGKITGTMNGEFLTLLKKGTIEGSLLGTYDGTTSGIWQATAAGTYAKTQDVSFSSEIWGDSHALASGKTGQVEGDGYGYRFYYNPEGNNRYGTSEYGYYDSSSQTNKKVIRRFDIQGPPEAKLPHQDIWVQDIKNIEDPSDDTYTFETIVYQNDDGSPDYAAYYADMASLETNPKTGGSVTAYDSMQFHNYNFNGIMAGVDNLWTNIDNNAATTIYLMGDIETESVTPKLFTGTVVSFNPLATLDPYSNSQSPVKDDKYGSYFAYLGGAFGSTTTDAYDKIDGMTSGLYLAQDGSAGVLYGTISGDNDMNLGFWNASGSIKGYKLLSSTNTVTAGTFASLLNTTPPSQLHWIGNYLSADGALGGNTNITMAYFESTTTALDFSYYPAYWKESISPYGGFGTVKLLAGGTYVDPLSSYKVDFTFDTHNNQGLQSTIYSSTVWDTTITNNVYNGSVLHDGSFDPAKATGLVSVTVDHQQGGTLITGADIKGLFDPAAHTWQAVANGTAIETTAFVNLVNSFRTDAEKNAFMAALKIPAINVGAVNFTGGSGSGPNGSLSGVYMNNVGFYAYSTGQAPRIFASNEVGGNYTGVPVNTTVNWSGVSGTNMSNVSASLTTTAWNGSTWGATVTGSGTMASPSTGIVFKGGAAGSITPNPATPGTGVFGGSAAGIVGTAPAR